LSEVAAVTFYEPTGFKKALERFSTDKNLYGVPHLIDDMRTIIMPKEAVQHLDDLKFVAGNIDSSEFNRWHIEGGGVIITIRTA
jgi:hypothetical protein